MSMLASDWLSRLYRYHLKFSFHQQNVEFCPTHIFTHIYAPAPSPEELDTPHLVNLALQLAYRVSLLW